jgi:hypothetical protein
MPLPFPLRMGFDAKRAFFSPSGLGNYSRDSIRILIRYFPGNDYFLFTPGRNNALLFIEPEKCLICKPTGIIQKMLPALWRRFGISNNIYRNRINLYHELSNELPSVYALCVGTIEKRKNQLSIVKLSTKATIILPLFASERKRHIWRRSGNICSINL